jgi:hypothetical protein
MFDKVSSWTAWFLNNRCAFATAMTAWWIDESVTSHAGSMPGPPSIKLNLGRISREKYSTCQSSGVDGDCIRGAGGGVGDVTGSRWPAKRPRAATPFAHFNRTPYSHLTPAVSQRVHTGFVTSHKTRRSLHRQHDPSEILILLGGMLRRQ